MDEDALHPERIGDLARMLPTGAAETDERVAGDVMASRDRDLADRGPHVVHRDFQKAVGDVLKALFASNNVGDFLQACARCVPVERLVTARAEDRRKMVGLDPAEEQIAVGDGERPAVAIAGRSRLSSGGLRPDPEAHPVEAADRAAAGRDRVDLHHRRADPDPGDHAFVAKLELAGIMGDVGGGPAHVEPDQLVRFMRRAGGDHPDHAACRSREDGIFSPKSISFREASVGLHEVKRGSRDKPAADPLDVAPQHRREVGVDHGGVSARYQLDQRRNLVAD